MEDKRFCKKCNSPILSENKVQNEGQIHDHHLLPKYLMKKLGLQEHFTKEELNETMDLCAGCHKGLHKELAKICRDYAKFWSNLDGWEKTKVNFEKAKND